jgi:hypothetical protein
MSGFLVLDGEMVMFMPVFGAAIVAVRPGRIRSSGKAHAFGQRICVAGDERQVSVSECIYIAPPFVIAGGGTLVIETLAGDQTTATTQAGGIGALLVGSTFTAGFSVTTPAQQPPLGPGNPIPDFTPRYFGMGWFVSINTSVKAG